MSKRISLFCYVVKHKVCFPPLAPLGRLNVSDQKTVFTSCYVTVENILYTLYVVLLCLLRATAVLKYFCMIQNQNNPFKEVI